jgi:hypothetical protein
VIPTLLTERCDHDQSTVCNSRQGELAEYNLVGSGATWCDADNSTPISLWVGSQLYAALGADGYHQTCNQPTTDLHLEVANNPDDGFCSGHLYLNDSD